MRPVPPTDRPWPNPETEAVVADIRHEWADPNVMPFYTVALMDAQGPAVAILEQAEELRRYYASNYEQWRARKGFEELDLHPAMLESLDFSHAMTRYCLAHVDWVEVSRRLYAIRHLTPETEPEPLRSKNHPAFEALLVAVYEAIKHAELAYDVAHEAEEQDLYPRVLDEEHMSGMLWSLKQVFISLEGSLVQVEALDKARAKWREEIREGFQDREEEPQPVIVEEPRS